MCGWRIEYPILRLHSEVKVNYSWAIPSKVADPQKLPILKKKYGKSRAKNDT